MSKPLIVYDDTIISRTAHLIENRRRNIIELEMHLSGVVNNLQWSGVKREDLEKELAYQRQCLLDLYESLDSAPVKAEISKNIVRYCYGKTVE